MAVQPTYPGVYVEELPSSVRTITSVATSITAFVGYTARGPDNRAQRLFSFADFERTFGGLAADSELSYAVAHFFSNGGSEAVVVRVPRDGSKAAKITLQDKVTGGADSLTVTATSTGSWANSSLIDVDHRDVSDNNSFNFTIRNLATGTVETFKDVSVDKAKANYVEARVNDEANGSDLVSVKVVANDKRPAESGVVGGDLAIAANGDLTDIKALGATAGIKISSDLPAGKITNVDVQFLEAGDAKPTTVVGVCRLLERKINEALQKLSNVKGAAVRCEPTASDKGIRVIADFSAELLPNSLDPVLSFAAGAPSALAALKLSNASSSNNVAHYWLGKGHTTAAQSGAQAGTEGNGLPKTAALVGNQAKFTGLYALEKVDLFNILCIPDATRSKPDGTLDSDVTPNAIFDKAMTYCRQRRAFLIVDPQSEVDDTENALEWITTGLTVKDNYGAAYFPRLRLPDPLKEFQLRTFAPCGVVAGIYARTDAERGVWKAPAGIDARLRGVQAQAYKLNDAENGTLNPLGLNCFRNFPIYGNVIWGARTLEGADAQASQWKYIPVRRLALNIEESLFRGTKWVVFEPNDEPLWAQIRLNVGSFMQRLFRQGAFQGKTPREAYFVRCDKTTTTQDDIDNGIVNIVVGFAPLKPAEFVIIKIQQIANQAQA